MRKLGFGLLSVFALTLASWPGGPVAHARIVAHGPPPEERANGVVGAALAAPGDVHVETFDVVVVNTEERATVRCTGVPAHADAESLARLRHLLRALPSDKEGPFDPALADVLLAIAQRTGGPIEVVSGYRVPRNRWDHNYHVRGQAADVRVPGVPTWKLVRLVKKLGVRGVGNYPTSAFVHVDTRDEPFSWTDWSGPSHGR